MTEREPIQAAHFDDRVRYILELLENGRMTVPDARRRLQGMSVPPGPARQIKDGRWASEGSYPTGVRGARLAARDALNQEQAVMGTSPETRDLLVEFALWISDVSEADNSDDRESAETAVDAFLSGESRD